MIWTADTLMYSGVSYDAAYSGSTLLWQKRNYEEEYLTLEVISGGTLGWGLVDATAQVETMMLEYSLNGGEWTTLSTSIPLNVSAGDSVRIKNPSWVDYDKIEGMHFYGTAYFNACGNIMSLVYNNFSGKKVFPATTSCIKSVFQSSNVVDASNLILPATAVTFGCYVFMFRWCTSLTSAPALPATSLSGSCYAYMFWGCRSLTKAPQLPATTLAGTCYASMFNGCWSLVTPPSLPATTLAGNCYFGMFDGCKSLTTAPQLPATTLTLGCYQDMFRGCTSLTTAPELPATVLTPSCYYSMFEECTQLNYIKCLATTDAANALLYWTKDVSSSGTFVKNASATFWLSGANGIPSGWTVVDA